MVKCSFCGSNAVYMSDKGYCDKHFVKYFENKVKSTIKKYKLFRENDKIIVACSGGKDSTTVLYLLNKLFKVEAIAIDEGIKGYRKHTLIDLKQFCKQHEIPLHIYSFKQEFGFNLDKIKDENRICMHCGVLRRYLLNKKSRGFDKLTTGHNLDDEAQSILMNLFKTNIGSLVRLGPISGVVKDPKFVPRVKPLYLCTEKETFIYSRLMQFDINYAECPYAITSFRAGVRDALNDYEQSNPGSKANLVENFLSLIPRLKKEYAKSKRTFGYCKLCGEPSTLNICNACYLVKNIKTKL